MTDKTSTTYQDLQGEIQTERAATIIAGGQTCSPVITFRRGNTMKKPMTTGELLEKTKSILKLGKGDDNSDQIK